MKLLALGFLVAASLFGDQVTLKNGDRITGKIVKKTGDSLSIKTELMGEVTVKWANVTAVTTDAAVVVVAGEGEPLKGRLATSGADLQVAGAAETKAVPLAKVGALRNDAEQAKYERFLHPSITELWAGFVDVGMASVQGNAKTLSFTSSVNATRASRTDTINLHFNQIYARGLVGNVTTDTAKAIRGGWSYNRNLTPKIFVNTFNDYEYDAFQNLDLRVVLGSGLGWKVWKTDKGLFDVVAGANWDRDKFSTAITSADALKFSRQSGEFYWGNDLSYKLGPRSSFKQSFRMFDNLTSTGDYRVNLDIGAETKIARWLSWQVTASERYLTNPAVGRKKNDLLVSSGIRLTFAR
jgi:putative salt-induced outer membrane protein YdiY